jgi:hypothetical protein
MQNLLSYGGARAVDNGKIRHYVANARISWVDCDDVAAVGAECLRNPELHNGKIYRLASDEKTFYEVADTLSLVLEQPFVYEARPPSEFMQKILAAGADPAYMHSAYENYALYTAGKAPEPGADHNVMTNLLGRKGKSWAEFAAQHAAHFQYWWSLVNRAPNRPSSSSKHGWCFGELGSDSKPTLITNQRFHGPHWCKATAPHFDLNVRANGASMERLAFIPR